jgi:membrane protein DedA with SNARE-associated domain
VIGLVQDIIRFLAPAYTTFGYAIVAGGVLAERSILIGLVVPGDILLALGGIYSARGHLDLQWVIVIGTIAAICGESIGYYLGRRYGMRLIRRIPLVRLLEDRLEGAEEYFRRHGGKTVAIGRYATAAGAFVPFVAGMARMRYRRFLAFDVPAIAIWAAGITLFGYYFNEQLDFVDRVLSRFGLVILLLLVLFIGGRIAFKRISERRKAKSSSSR